MTKPHRYSANAILRVLLAYKAREGEYPNQRVLAAEAGRSLAHTNSMVKILADQGYVKLSKVGNRIIEARAEVAEPEKEKTNANPF